VSSVLPLSDEIVCHCLRIAASEVRTAVETAQVTTVRQVMKATEAGTGCTVCHCKIRELIAEHQAKLAQNQDAESLV
jgi:bacterioferritin-associated ferredoxin